MAAEELEGSSLLGMTHEYDEDLSQNPFFKTFLQSYVELFSQCVQERWLICVPRLDSLPKYAFTLEDFTHHILKPINLCQELKSRPASVTTTDSNTSSPIQTLSRESSCSNFTTVPGSGCGSIWSSSYYNNSSHELQQRKWNFRTLAEINIEYTEKMLYMDTTADVLPVDSFSPPIGHHHHHVNNNPRAIPLLFDETFYTTDKQKYKVLCISSPINSQMESDGSYYNVEDRNPGMWKYNSLRDCIDFLWVNGRPNTLETFDAYIKLFLHNHRSLQDLPLPVQRDLVHDLYRRCLSYSIKSESKLKKLSSSSRDQYSSSETISSSGSSSTNSNHSTQNFQLATETYILNGIYRQLIGAITSSVSFEDSVLNKAMRNVADIHPQDLGINNIHWESLSRARQELGRLPMHATPLGKLKCLQKTMNYLKQDRTFEIDPDKTGVISTDELLPIWVYLLVKSPIGNWMAQLQFLRQFRFSAYDKPDNESSFFIVTLEASLLFLNSGKISGGLAESERDVGTPYQDYIGEFWLRSLFNNTTEEENTLAEMFTAIRLGNLEKLEQLINDYESVRRNQDDMKLDPFDDSKLCHPLCNCPKCDAVTHPKIEPKMESILTLKNEECGLSLLHVACVYGRPKVVDYLLSLEAPFDIQDNQGRLPIHYASSRGHQNALLLLLHAGCPIDIVDHSLNTPLHLASMNGHESCVKAIIYYAEHSKKILEVSAKNCNGDTSLHFACRFGFLGIVQLLVESGASISVTNARQRSPLDVARDIHVTRILQRSICRRSLVHKNHGDFVNVEVVKKGESEGLLMLISDPKPQLLDQDSQDGDTNFLDPDSPVPKSRRGSTSSIVSNSGTLTRRTSLVVTPSFTPSSSIREGVVDSQPSRSRSRKKRSIHNPDGTEDVSDDMIFHISNVVPEIQFEPEHLRKISVDNLDNAPHLLEEFARSGAKEKSEFQERGLRKLFSAIEIGDTPLALFYLGIADEELDNAAMIEPGCSSVFEECHPLCPCSRCAARSAGLLCKLGLDINIMSSDGLTALHYAVMNNNHPLVKILLKYGADINIRSLNGSKTALEYAKERYYEDIAVTLQLWKINSSTNGN